MPGHWEGRTLSEAKGHGEIPSVIHGSPIGKPYPSSVASLRSLDFSNLANWNILVAKGREINRDPVSSGERERIGGLKKNKHEASFPGLVTSFLSFVFTYFSPGFILFVVDWMMENPASYGLPYYYYEKEKGLFYRKRGWVRGAELEERSEPR